MPTDGTDQDPARSTCRLSIARLLACVCVIALATGLGAAAGLTRKPVYTSSVDVGIGTGGLSGNSIPGYAQAVKALAANYSRTIQSPAIANEIARNAGVDPVVVVRQVSASPIPDSSIVRLTVTSDDPEAAISLANSAAATFAEVIDKQIGSATDLVPLQQIKEAKLRVLEAQRTTRRLKADGVSRNNNRYLRAQAESESRNIRLRALTTRYEQSRATSNSLTSEVVRVTRSAATDRRSVFMLYTVFGFLIGTVLAFALWNVFPNRTRSTAAEA
ncbi:MAG: hypothetical protein Q7T73_09415 [Beijerinckiaceae bacterium]|nr:hypothetical protein [Beijerinckiaceae bacterium]